MDEASQQEAGVCDQVIGDLARRWDFSLSESFASFKQKPLSSPLHVSTEKKANHEFAQTPNAGPPGCSLTYAGMKLSLLKVPKRYMPGTWISCQMFSEVSQNSFNTYKMSKESQYM